MSNGAIVFEQDGQRVQERVVLEAGFTQDLAPQFHDLIQGP